MKIKKIYVAEDGREFETEKECHEYEMRDMLLPEFIRLFDDNNQPIVWNATEAIRMWEIITTIAIAPMMGKEATEWFGDRFYDLTGGNPFDDLEREECDDVYASPNEVLYIHWDGYGWQNLNYQIRQRQEIINSVNKEGE